MMISKSLRIAALLLLLVGCASEPIPEPEPVAPPKMKGFTRREALDQIAKQIFAGKCPDMKGSILEASLAPGGLPGLIGKDEALFRRELGISLKGYGGQPQKVKVEPIKNIRSVAPELFWKNPPPVRAKAPAKGAAKDVVKATPLAAPRAFRIDLADGKWFVINMTHEAFLCRFVDLTNQY